MLAARTRLGPYEIRNLLGSGGMGEVYRAHDTRLGRDVAIKVLPVAFVADLERLRRFEQEARATAAFSHPNILSIHDIGRHEDAPYLVEELLEGESLRTTLKGGALRLRAAIEIAVQVCSGLAAAHEKGIVHRDIKPENLFITRDGTVKILDFGLARLREAGVGHYQEDSVTTAQTGSGFVLGTAAYMSPEQARGLSLDERSDIFSFGAVLYEMLSGRQPFARETATDTLAAIIKEDPDPLSAPGREIPETLQRIVGQCLAKRPEDRFSSAHDLALALRILPGSTSVSPTQPSAVAPPRSLRRRLVIPAVAAAAVAAAGLGVWALLSRAPSGHSQVAQRPPVKIVVLPFDNLGSADDAYFAAGMAEEITSRLANVQGLGVISRTSAVAYDRKAKSIRQIGGDLGVDYVLEGSVRWDHGAGRESRVRITPQLIRVADDTHVWSERYERVLADVFSLQSEVAESAVRAMGVTLLPRERSALKEVSTNDLDAYGLYLRGRELESHGDIRSDIEEALRMYQEAVRRDPRFAQAHAGLARTNLTSYWEYYDRSQQRLVEAKAAAERAVELRADLAEAHTALGLYYYQGMLDYEQALNAFAAALEHQPNYADALWGIGLVLRRQGRWQGAVEKLKAVVNLDPQNATRSFDLGLSNELAWRFADAESAFARSLALFSRAPEVHAERAWLQLLWKGDAQKAQAILDEASRVTGVSDESGYLAEVQFLVGLARRDYQGALERLEAEARGAIDNQDTYSPIPLWRGQIYRLTGQHDLARRSFEAARVELERKVRADPDDHRFHSSLGIAYAGLGRRDDAVREARRGGELMPASKDALRAIQRLQDLALVYTMGGKQAEAIAALDDLLSRSGWYTVHVLRLDPRWDPLRSDPRFQALLSKREVKS